MSKGSTSAAIDIGSTKITTVIVAPSPDNLRQNVIGVASTPSAGIRKSQVVDIEEAITAIGNSVSAAERMAGVPVNSAYISISGDHIQSQNSKGVVAIGNPEGEIVDDDLKRVIEAAQAVSIPSSREILHVLPREYAVDTQPGVKDPRGMSGVRLESEVHIVTGASGAIKNIQKCVNEVGVDISGMVFAGLASAHAVLTDTEKELGVVLVDIGGGSTSVAVFIEGSLSHSAVLPVGAKNITNDLAIGLRISLDSAEKIKQYLSELAHAKHDIDESKPSKKDDELDLNRLNLKEELHSVSRKTLVDGIIRPRLNEIFTLVGDELKRSGFAGATPAGIVLTGGGSETAEIVNACKRTLQLPTRVGIPQGLSGLIDEIGTPAHATAVGLILHSLSTTPVSNNNINLARVFKSVGGKDIFSRLVNFVKSLLP